MYLFGFFALNFPLYDINNYYIVYITQRDQSMANLFKKTKSAVSNYVGSVKGDANAIGSQLKGKLGSMSALSNTFDQRIADGLGDLLTGATGIRTSNIPEISSQVMDMKGKNREARAKVLNDAMSGRADVSPSPGIKLQFPESFANEKGEGGNLTNYIHFRSLERNVKDKAGEKKYDIFLYVPDALTDNMSIEYGEAEKGLMEGLVGGLFANEGGAGTDMAELGQLLIGGAPGGDIIKQSMGKTINPLKFQLFKGVAFRTFSYNFTLRPTSSKESSVIKEMVHAFRLSALPGTTGDNDRIYTFPNEWAIRFHGPFKDYIDYPLVSVLTGVNVDWTGGQGFTHMIDGAPAAITLTLEFVETSTLDRTKYKGGVSAFANTGSNTRETTQDERKFAVVTSDTAAELKGIKADNPVVETEDPD